MKGVFSQNHHFFGRFREMFEQKNNMRQEHMKMEYTESFAEE